MRSTTPSDDQEVDVLVVGLDVLQQNANRSTENRNIAQFDFRIDWGDELDLEAGFLQHLTARCLLRQLVRLNMSTRRQPGMYLVVPQEQCPSFLNHERGGGKVPGCSRHWQLPRC